MWDDDEVVEKVTRLREEGKMIYERNAVMNQKGIPGGGDVMRANSEVLFGRRHRTNLVIRLRGKTEEQRRGSWLHAGEDERKAMCEERRRKKHQEALMKGKEEAKMRAMVARLARRPWRKKQKLPQKSQLGVIRNAREKNNQQVSSMEDIAIAAEWHFHYNFGSTRL